MRGRGRTIGHRSSEGTIELQETHPSTEARTSTVSGFCCLQKLVSPFVSNVVESEDNVEMKLLDKEKKEEVTPSVPFDYPFMTRDRCRDVLDLSRQQVCVQNAATCCGRNGPTAYSISFLVGFIQDMGFRRIVLHCDNAPSTKSLQDVVIQACAGVEVVPQGPPEGDHVANGRVKMAEREDKRQCRTLRISAERQTSVRIAHDSRLLSSPTCHEQNESWQRCENM